MRPTILVLALMTGALALSAAPADAQGRVPNCTTTGKNLYVRDVLTDLYYWYEFLPAVDPARFDSPEAYLEAVRYRPLDHAFSYVTSREANEAFFSESQYIGLGLSTSSESGQMRVLQVFDQSPAAEAGLGRGHTIVEINGRPVAALIESGQIGSAFGPSEIGVTTDVVFATHQGETTRVRMTKRAVTIPTVSLTRVFQVDGRRVGYVFFRNFVRPSYEALDAAFATLRDAKVSELVLDLRYNGGGLVDVATHLASLIGGTPTSGLLFGRYVHNAKNHAYDEDLRLGDAAQALGLSRLFVITTQGSASASELIINGLRPHMPVTVVGDRTYGKPVGQYGIPFCDKVVAPVAFSIRNAADQGDYFDGIPADCLAGDDVTHDLGDLGEASLAEALHVVRTGACSTRAGARESASRIRGQRAPVSGARATGWQSVVNAW
jgi:carboxyl-terminal processing protease